MNVLVLGAGAREHALAVHLQRSQSVRKVILAPGNALAAREVMTASVDAGSPEDVLRLVRTQHLDFVVIGPEAPLLAGVADALSAAGIAVLGPSKAAAMLEGSKDFAKRTMQEACVPTARFFSFVDTVTADAWLDAHPGAYAVKADGLMAGKGVIVCDDASESKAAVRELFAAGQTTVLIEQRLRGQEVSLIALCDGENAQLFPLARDHKRLLSGELGKNTGGMGAFCPVVLPVSADALAALCITPILRTMAARGTPYRGFLYAGVMFDAGKPYVLEYNARLGDPETQVLLGAVDGDLCEAFFAAASGGLAAFPLHSGAAVCIVLAARGYPDRPVIGDPITGIDAAKKMPHVSIYGAGVAERAGQLVTAGGRVLSIVGHGGTVAQARAHAYAAVACIHFDGMQYRADIAG